MSPLVKICGLCDEAGVEAAVSAGADAIGFVLAPSPRRVSPARARELLALVPPSIARVAVFGRATRSALAEALELEFDFLQAEYDSDWPPLRTGVHALAVLRDGVDLEARAAGVPRPGAAPTHSLVGCLVLDGPSGGGQGRPADVERAARLARTRPIVLAGGLDPSNVAARVSAIRPFAVDTSSGVERVRGTKDPALIHAFVKAVRTHAAQENPS